MRNREVIDSKEAAKILGLSRSQVNRRAAAGVLPYLSKSEGLRTPYIFDRSEIERLAKEKVA